MISRRRSRRRTGGSRTPCERRGPAPAGRLVPVAHDRGAAAALPRRVLRLGHESARLVAGGPELPASRFCPGARRESAAGAHRAGGDHPHVDARGRGRSHRPVRAGSAHLPRHELVRAAARAGAPHRVRRAVGRPHDRHAASGAAGEDRGHRSCRHPGARNRAGDRRERRCRLRGAVGRCGAHRARRDLRRERTAGGALRRVLQHPASRR